VQERAGRSGRRPSPRLVIIAAVALAAVAAIVVFVALPALRPGSRSPGASVPTTSEQVLCDGQTFDGYADTPFVFKSDVAQDPSIRKIIRNCTFRNSAAAAILLRSARNVVIEASTFENIRTNVPGRGVHGIYIQGDQTAEDILITGNTFRSIGADGIQMGDAGRNVRNLTITGNTFEGAEGIGENAVDVKAVDGPITISDNVVRGYRPCVSPLKGGTQDCSGSNGTGVVVHNGRAAGPAANVRVEGNDISDNVTGLVVSSGASHVTVSGNRIHDNGTGLLVDQVTDISITANVFMNNTLQVRIESVSSGCTLSGNELVPAQAIQLRQTVCPVGP
jgi:nitrous oxidase accessory protein NosD